MSRACAYPQGLGIDEILEAIVHRIPAPAERAEERLRALIFDSYYDLYKVATLAAAFVGHAICQEPMMP